MAWAEENGIDIYDDDYGVIYIKSLLYETEKAYLFHDNYGDFWIAKSIVYSQEGNKLYVANWFKPTYLKRNYFKGKNNG